MSKFKVGDKVRILDGSKINDYYGGWTDNMKKYIDKIYTINEVLKRNRGIAYRMKEIGYVWDERCLELTEGPKFKVGDVVIAKKNNGYCITNNGWRGVVTYADDRYFSAEEFGYSDLMHRHSALRYDGFDLANDQKIVITHDGKTTTAKLFNNKQVIKTAKARCCPSDEFDFNIGAAIALERLTGCAYGHLESTLDSDLQWNRFMTSKIAFKVPMNKFEKFLKECEERDLRWASGKRATAWNPVKETRYTFEKYVYMYHDEDGLFYDADPCDGYAFEVWDFFDWAGFKAGKFNVVVTRDSSSRFLEECGAHEIAYIDKKATEFNPIKYIDKINPLAKALILTVLDADSTDECEFEVEEGKLVYSFKPEIKKSTVRYD